MYLLSILIRIVLKTIHNISIQIDDEMLGIMGFKLF